MKNKNSRGLQLIIVIILLGIGTKICTNKKESTNTYTTANFIDTVTTFKDSALNNKSTITKKKKKKNSQIAETVLTNPYSTPIKTRQNKKRAYSKSNNSSGCSTTQCNASTKKRRRCRNMTTNCNGYCWRHGG